MRSATKPRIFRVGPTDRLIRVLARSVVFRYQAPHLVTLFKDPERALRRSFEVKFCGFRYCGELNNDTDWSVYFLANFLGPEVDLLKQAAATTRRSRDRFVCYDVGANIGHMTLAMASVADEVIALEPSPYAIVKLQEQVVINGISNVRYLNLALGEDDEVVPFQIFSAVNFQAKPVRSAPVEQSVGRFDAARMCVTQIGFENFETAEGLIVEDDKENPQLPNRNIRERPIGSRIKDAWPPLLGGKLTEELISRKPCRSHDAHASRPSDIIP